MQHCVAYDVGPNWGKTMIDSTIAHCKITGKLSEGGIGAGREQPRPHSGRRTGDRWPSSRRFPAKLKRVELGGGPAVTLCDLANSVGNQSMGGTWSRDGVIIFQSGSELYRVAAAGGVPVKLPASPGPQRSNPSFLPDGQRYLFHRAAQGKSGIWVGSLSSAEATKLTDASGGGQFAASAPSSTRGYLLYSREQTLMAQGFESSKLRLEGEPFPVGENIAVAGPGGGLSSFSASGTGVLAFQTGGRGDQQVELSRFDRSGRGETVAAQVPTPNQSFARRDTCCPGRRQSKRKMAGVLEWRLTAVVEPRRKRSALNDPK